MEPTLFVICDYASISVEGKLSIAGIFEDIYASEFPVMFPQFFIVTVFHRDPGDMGSGFDVRIDMIDTDGQMILSIEQPVRFHEDAPLARSHRNLMRLNGIVFPGSGTYELRLFLNTEAQPRRTLMFHVVQQ
jgi:hypothetical protein